MRVNPLISSEILRRKCSTLTCHHMLKIMEKQINKKIAKLGTNNVAKIRGTLANNTLTGGFVSNKGEPHAAQYIMGTGTQG